jgi:hypothetical protein
MLGPRDEGYLLVRIIQETDLVFSGIGNEESRMSRVCPMADGVVLYCKSRLRTIHERLTWRKISDRFVWYNAMRELCALLAPAFDENRPTA